MKDRWDTYGTCKSQVQKQGDGPRGRDRCGHGEKMMHVIFVSNMGKSKCR